MINKKNIQKKIMRGDLEEAISMFLDLANEYDESLHEEVIMLSIRFNSLKREKSAAMIDYNSAKTTQNRINYDLIQLISEINENWSLKEESDSNSPNSENKIEKKTILFLAANPKDTPPIRIDEEVKRIEEGLERSKNREFFELKQKWALEYKGLRRALLDEHPNIIHFSGHGSKLGKIYLENSNGDSVEIDPETIADLFDNFSEIIDCVILNACYSEYQAQEISKSIDFVIGMSNKISDIAAIEFSEAFYDSLANGRDIEFSFKLAKNAVKVYGLDSDNLPVLIRKMQ